MMRRQQNIGGKPVTIGIDQPGFLLDFDITRQQGALMADDLQYAGTIVGAVVRRRFGFEEAKQNAIPAPVGIAVTGTDPVRQFKLRL